MTTRIPGGGIALTLTPSDLRRMAAANGPLPRYCIAKDRDRWRVYDDVYKRFAESSDKASKRPEARERAQKMNIELAPPVTCAHPSGCTNAPREGSNYCGNCFPG